VPIPSTRAELIEAISGAYSKLQAEHQRLGPDIAEQVCVDEWTVKQVLAIRAWWTHSVVDWIEAWQRGESPELPAPGYRWNETPRLNADLAAAATDRAYGDVLRRLDEGVARVIEVIGSLQDAELLEVGAFPSAGKWPVSRWISINTGRQYTTARTYIRRTFAP